MNGLFALRWDLMQKRVARGGAGCLRCCVPVGALIFPPSFFALTCRPIFFGSGFRWDALALLMLHHLVGGDGVL